MELIFILFIILGIFFFVKKKVPPLAPVELNVEELTVYVGNKTAWSPYSGFTGGTKFSLYKDLSIRNDHLMDYKSDGTLNGDLNMFYIKLKRGLAEATADFTAYSHLDLLFNFIDAKALSEEIKIPTEIIEKQREIAENLECGDRVKIIVKKIALRRNPNKTSPREQVFTLVELVAIEESRKIANQCS